MMVQGPGFFTTFLYYFSSTTLIVVLVASQGMNLSLETHLPYQFGILLGLAAGLLGATFNRSATLSASFRSQQAFLNTLDTVLGDLGYHQSQHEDGIVYEKTPLQTLFSGRIWVQIDKHSATITGRAKHLQKLNHLL